MLANLMFKTFLKFAETDLSAINKEACHQRYLPRKFVCLHLLYEEIEA